MDFFKLRQVLSLALPLFSLQARAAIYNYSNPNDDFSPTSEHEQAHQISGEDFERNSAYVTAVLTTPIILCVLGAISIFIFDILICLCSAKIPAKDGHAAAWALYYMLAIGALIAAACVYIGYTGIVDGFDSLDDSIALIQNKFEALVLDGEALRADYNTMYDSCTVETVCCDATVLAFLAEVDRSLGHFEDDTNGVVANAEDVYDYMQQYGDYGLMFTLLIFLFMLFAVIFYVSFAICKSKAGMTCACCWGNTTFIIVMILGAICMMLTSVVGDICYKDPTYAILTQVPPGKGQQYLTWYSTCGATGSNPIFGFTDIMTEYNLNVIAELDSLAENTPSCSSDSDFQAVYSAANNSLATISYAVEIADCPDVQKSWLKTINDGLCGSLFEGVRTCWLVALISTLLIFILQVPSAIIRNALGGIVVVPSDNSGPANAHPVEYQDEQPKVKMVPMSAHDQSIKHA